MREREGSCRGVTNFRARAAREEEYAQRETCAAGGLVDRVAPPPSHAGGVGGLDLFGEAIGLTRAAKSPNSGGAIRGVNKLWPNPCVLK